MVDANTLPLGARGPGKDVQTGITETGQPMYQGVTGQGYTLREMTPSSQWTTEAGTMARAGEVAKYRLRELGESIVSGVTAPVRALRGEPVTQGEAMNTAGMVMVGGAPVPVPAGAMRVFGGASRNLENWNRFKLNQDKGMDPQRNFELTKFYEEADGTIKFEIPDSQSDWYLKPDEVDVGQRYNLSDVYSHEQLFSFYPEAENIGLKIKRDSGNYLGLYNPGTQTIHLNMTAIEKNFQREGFKNPESFARSILIHEIQHWIQDTEGFVGRGTTTNSPYVVNRAAQDVTENIEMGLVRPEDFHKEFNNGVFEWYSKEKGEVEARNVESRLSNPQQRLWIPLKTQDVPEYLTARKVQDEQGQLILKYLGEIDASTLPQPSTGPR